MAMGSCGGSCRTACGVSCRRACGSRVANTACGVSCRTACGVSCRSARAGSAFCCHGRGGALPGRAGRTACGVSCRPARPACGASCRRVVGEHALGRALGMAPRRPPLVVQKQANWRPCWRRQHAQRAVVASEPEQKGAQRARGEAAGGGGPPGSCGRGWSRSSARDPPGAGAAAFEYAKELPHWRPAGLCRSWRQPRRGRGRERGGGGGGGGGG